MTGTETAANQEAQPLLELVEVTKRFGSLVAVDHLSLQLHRGETLGMVGESGCGKSTVARLIVGLEEPSSGQLRFDGQPYSRSQRGLRRLRGRLGMIFQDPYESLDPRCSLLQIVGEPLKAHGRWRDRGPMEVQRLLQAVGLPGAALDSYPGQYSGGGRQRIAIARALALAPPLVVCDEPTSALDVSIQAQVVNLLLELQRERGLSYLFISHDLDVVRRLADRIMVIYSGAAMEEGPAELVSEQPLHPYTKALLSAVPGTGPQDRRLGQRTRLIEEHPASPTGCPFASRCPAVHDACAIRPSLVDVGDGRKVACHLVSVPEADPPKGAAAKQIERASAKSDAGARPSLFSPRPDERASSSHL